MNESWIAGRLRSEAATEASPETGQRDAEPVRALHGGWGHRDFGVYARVTKGGMIATGKASNE